MRYLIDLFKDYLSMVWHAFGGLLWLAVLVVAAVSTSPWLYHSLFAIAFLIPCAYFIRYSFHQRIQEPSNRQKSMDNIGTLLSLMVAGFFLTAYIACLYMKMS